MIEPVAASRGWPPDAFDVIAIPTNCSIVGDAHRSAAVIDEATDRTLLELALRAA